MKNLRSDLIPSELLVNPESLDVTIADGQPFRYLLEHSIDAPTRTPGASKDIIEVTELIEQAIRDYEKRFKTTKESEVEVVFERPEKVFEKETISISFASRSPGMFAQGRPQENKVKNLRPVLRQVVDDPDNPGYKRAILGYYYDNIIRITAWARTNKVANKRAIWLENLMEEYNWWFVYSGVNRIIYEGWQSPVFLDINNNLYFGRPIDFYVRTEKLTNVSQKTLEEIQLRLSVSNSVF